MLAQGTRCSAHRCPLLLSCLLQTCKGTSSMLLHQHGRGPRSRPVPGQPHLQRTIGQPSARCHLWQGSVPGKLQRGPHSLHREQSSCSTRQRSSRSLRPGQEADWRRGPLHRTQHVSRTERQAAGGCRPGCRLGHVPRALYSMQAHTRHAKHARAPSQPVLLPAPVAPARRLPRCKVLFTCHCGRCCAACSSLSLPQAMQGLRHPGTVPAQRLCSRVAAASSPPGSAAHQRPARRLRHAKQQMQAPMSSARQIRRGLCRPRTQPQLVGGAGRTASRQGAAAGQGARRQLAGGSSSQARYGAAAGRHGCSWGRGWAAQRGLS